MTSTPTLKWAQRVDKVFVTFEVQAAKDVNVVFSDGLLSIDAKAGSTTYKLENMTLFMEIISEDSKWFHNDRAIVMSLKKKEAEWWDGLTKDKTLKRFIKTDFAKWCEEEDPEYTGDIPDPGGGMGDGPPPLESDSTLNTKDMEEVD